MSPKERLPAYLRNTVLHLSEKGWSSSKISRHLSQHYQISYSERGVRFLINRERLQCNGPRRPKTTRPLKRKLNDIHESFIQLWMRQEKELNSLEIKEKLLLEFGVKVSRRCVNYHRQRLGWTGKRMKYCQLISNNNISKRFNYSVKMLATKEAFENVIFVDETTVEMSSNGRLAFYQRNTGIDKLPPKAPKPKHAYKVHLWGGISYRGRTHCCVFTGVMDSVIYQKILRDNLLPFVRDVFPDGYRFYQDNDSKHKSASTKKWMDENAMTDKLMETPASSPDLNPIENVWATMKDFIQRKIKPKKKDELVNGIKQFWESLTPEKCGRYIDHLHKVLPEVVLNNGGPTKY